MTSHDIEGARARLEKVAGGQSMASVYRTMRDPYRVDLRAILADHSRLLERVRELEDSSRNTGNHLCGSRDEPAVGVAAALAKPDLRVLIYQYHSQMRVSDCTAIRFKLGLPSPPSGLGDTEIRKFDLENAKKAGKLLALRSEMQAIIRAATPQASASGKAEGGAETGWLIEEYSTKTQQFKGRWWNGEAFTRDSLDALRFGRRRDAQRYIDDIGWTEAVPTEHRWR
jgi:hypothetical protein